MISSTYRRTLPTLARPYRHCATLKASFALKCSSTIRLQSVEPRTRRQFSQSTRLTYPRKDSQDKDSINTEATEYSKSGTDDEGARQEDAAFNPDVTDPQHEKDVAGKGSEGTDKSNPLEVSPANPDVSKARGKTEGGAENSSAGSGTTSGKQRSSGGGGPPRGSKVT